MVTVTSNEIVATVTGRFTTGVKGDRVCPWSMKNILKKLDK